MVEAYVKGVSTRKVDDLVKALGIDGISKSEVSRLCKVLVQEVEAFRNSPIDDECPYVILDATFLKVPHPSRKSGSPLDSRLVAIALADNLRTNVLDLVQLDWIESLEARARPGFSRRGRYWGSNEGLLCCKRGGAQVRKLRNARFPCSDPVFEMS